MGQLYDGRKIDVWSMGCVIFILLTHRMAFKEKSGHHSIIKQQKDGVHWPSHVVEKISEEAKAFVEYILVFDSYERPMVYDIVRHYFLADVFRDNNVNSGNRKLSEQNDAFSVALSNVSSTRRRSLSTGNLKHTF